MKFLMLLDFFLLGLLFGNIIGTIIFMIIDYNKIYHIDKKNTKKNIKKEENINVEPFTILNKESFKYYTLSKAVNRIYEKSIYVGNKKVLIIKTEDVINILNDELY